jgi:hypothetical protein
MLISAVSAASYSVLVEEENKMFKESLTRVRVDRGSEGPDSDPYSYEEITVERNGHRYCLHLGLLVSLEVDGSEVEFKGENWEAQTVAEFERLTGAGPNEWTEWRNRLDYYCSCGGAATESARGYPGEHFNICNRCGRIVSSYVNWGEIE